MAQSKNRTISVNNIEISISSISEEDYISLTDMAKGFSEDDVLVKSWLRAKQTIDFLGAWEKINNPNFNWHEFDLIRMDAGSNAFSLSAKKWIESTNAIGLIAKAGRYGGTYAHKDIAFEFGSWLSPEFKLYLIKEFQRLKEHEAQQTSLEWQVKRELSKVNYRIHTDAVQMNLLNNLPESKHGFVYANEADLFNVVVFGMTNKEWKRLNPTLKGNQRDNASALDNHLIASIELHNAYLIDQKLLNQSERLPLLQKYAERLRASLNKSPAMKRLEQQSNTPLLKDIDK